MSNPAAGTPMTEEEAIEFANQVFQVAREGDADMLGRLLEKGLAPNLRNHKGDSLLMLASYHGHHRAVEVLLQHGADPELRNDNGQVPLAGAAFKGDLEMVRLLLDGGADVEGAGADGKTVLMMAAMFNRVAIIDLLLERGADPAARDGRGIDALGAAQAMGAEDSIARLTRNA
ncbi:ankyrin repeat domain-containing protein [Pseudomonas sp. RIT-PI-AD]|uniref:ankyrin repeat domain-containing protein n=1 Tax=Pseudomonas sp. RIT-PI-AD TaxID=3035294 RepID=UPI0021DA7B53|nr:ankyrin repeat domain-containing protein [Pseudomonas sp. RIT-PI-AD]